MRVVIDTNVWMFVSLITIDGQSLQSPPSLRFPPLRKGNPAARPFGSPCVQGEP